MRRAAAARNTGDGRHGRLRPGEERAFYPWSGLEQVTVRTALIRALPERVALAVFGR